MRLRLLLARVWPLWSIKGLAYSEDAQHGDAELDSTEMGLLRPRDSDVRAAAKATIDAMNDKFYDSSKASWSPSEPWWLSGVALSSVIEYMRKTGTNDYVDQVKHIIQTQRGNLSWWPQGNGDFRADSTDDTGWWALAMVAMYDLTLDQTYLNISIEDEAYIYSYWTDKPCGGGIYVDIKKKTYKNAIANELYIKLAASLHNRINGDTEYLAKAEKAWSWFKGSGMINGDNLINDGLISSSSGACSNNKLPIWTYNQGVILGGLVGM
jgi:predicted alpha-1,6-mannanase (GH76 family)